MRWPAGLAWEDDPLSKLTRPQLLEVAVSFLIAPGIGLGVIWLLHWLGVAPEIGLRTGLTVFAGAAVTAIAGVGLLEVTFGGPILKLDRFEWGLILLISGFVTFLSRAFAASDANQIDVSPLLVFVLVSTLGVSFTRWYNGRSDERLSERTFPT